MICASDGPTPQATLENDSAPTSSPTTSLNASEVLTTPKPPPFSLTTTDIVAIPLHGRTSRFKAEDDQIVVREVPAWKDHIGVCGVVLEKFQKATENASMNPAFSIEGQRNLIQDCYKKKKTQDYLNNGNRRGILLSGAGREIGSMDYLLC